VDEERAEAGSLEWASDDDALMARLREMFRQEDEPPAVVVELAKQSFGLRAVDAELAALIADSDVDRDVAAVRLHESGVGRRLLTFETAELVVEIQVGGSGQRRRILGQLLPPDQARIEVKQPSAQQASWIDVDDEGRFVIENVYPGVVSLTCHRPGRRSVTTQWTYLE
jgi:hypothetical protein